MLAFLFWADGSTSPCQISPASVQGVAPAGQKTPKSPSELLKYRRFALGAMLPVKT